MKRLVALTHATAPVMVALLLFSTAKAAAEPIEVAADTRIEVEARGQGSVATVTGTLRDNVGQGLGFRSVDITVEPAPEEGVVVAVQTDRLGVFRWAGPVGEGEFEITASYDGDRYFDPVQDSTTLVTRRSEPVIRVAGPRTISVGAQAFGVQILATTPDGDVAPDLITVESACSGVRFEPATLAATIAPPVGPGLCDMRVAVPETEQHLAATETFTLRATEAPSLRAEADVVRLSPFSPPSWQVRGEVTDEAGPVLGGTVIIDIEGGQITEASWTDAGFEAAMSGETLVPGTHIVRVQWSPDHDRIEGEPIVLELEVIYERSAVEWVPLVSAGGVAAIVLAMLMLYARTRRRRPESPRQEVLSVVAGVATEEDDADADVWRGRVIDAATRESVAARVWFVFPDGREQELSVIDGRFELAPLDLPTVRLRAEAPGFLALDDRSSPPARGQRIVLRMVSVRSRVRAILESVVESVSSEHLGPRWWGRKTVEDVRPVLRDSLRALRRGQPSDPVARRELHRLLEAAALHQDPATAADALSLLADEVYFSGRPFDPEVIELAQSLADRVCDARPEAER